MTVRSKYLALACLIPLAGCALVDNRAPSSQGPETAAVTEREAEVPVPARKPVPPLQAALPPNDVSVPSVAPMAPAADPPRLEQMTPEQTIALFGEPTHRLERGSGIVWSYVRAGCELDLLFFMNVQTKVSRVLDYDLRTGDGSERSRQRCLEQLALERRSRDSGSSTRPR
jgi:hypothetical protein